MAWKNLQYIYNIFNVESIQSIKVWSFKAKNQSSRIIPLSLFHTSVHKRDWNLKAAVIRTYPKNCCFFLGGEGDFLQLISQLVFGKAYYHTNFNIGTSLKQPKFTLSHIPTYKLYSIYNYVGFSMYRGSSIWIRNHIHRWPKYFDQLSCKQSLLMPIWLLIVYILFMS